MPGFVHPAATNSLFTINVPVAKKIYHLMGNSARPVEVLSKQVPHLPYVSIVKLKTCREPGIVTNAVKKFSIYHAD